MKKTTRRVATKSKLPPVPFPKRKKINPLDKAIMEGRPLPIRGKKRIPSDSDVIIRGTKSSKPKFRRPQGR